MDRGTVGYSPGGHKRVGHNLVTKQPPSPNSLPQTEHIRTVISMLKYLVSTVLSEMLVW